MLNEVLSRLVDLLPPKLRPYAKSVLPFVATLVLVGVHAAATGEFNEQETKLAAEGIALSVVAWLFPNKGQPGVADEELVQERPLVVTPAQVERGE